jgi:hypothetical protein
MNKKQLKIVQDAKAELESEKEKVSDYVDNVILRTIDPQIEKIGNLQDELQAEYDDLSETAQEGDKGTKLQEEIDALGELKDELDTLKTEFDDTVFDDVIAKCDDVPGVVE